MNGDNTTSNKHGSFGVSADELTKLVDPKNPDLLKQLGGVKALAKKLRVDVTTGLSADEGVQHSGQEAFQERHEAFGRNVLPEAKSKTFLELLWASYNDKTLSTCIQIIIIMHDPLTYFVFVVMLTIASFVSLAVGIWEDYSPRHPPDEPRVGWYVLRLVVAGSFPLHVTQQIIPKLINDTCNIIGWKALPFSLPYLLLY